MSGLIYESNTAQACSHLAQDWMPWAVLRRCAAVVSTLLLGAAGITAHAQSTTPYNWNNVKIGGGGFITHIVPDPKTSGTFYARTDLGGAYKRTVVSGNVWVPITDIFGPQDASLTGVESIAVDPVDPERVYLAVGTHASQGSPNGAILVSNDSAKTFTRVNMPIAMGADDQGRFSGERLAVNPLHHSEIYFGSRNNGLWRSEDFGKTWAQLSTFPVTGPNSGVGVIFEFWVFTSAKTVTAYAGVSDPNVGLYSSTDGGKTWIPVAGQPTGFYPNNYALSPDGNVYITYGNAVGPDTLNGQGFSAGELYKYNTSTGAWAAITPPNPWGGVNGGYQNDGFGFSAVSVDRQNPNTIMVASMGRLWWPGEEIFRSLDGGATWWPIGNEPSWSEPGPLYNFSSRTDALAPYWSDPNCNTTSCNLTDGSFGYWLGALAIDPFNSNHVFYGTATGIWETQDVTNVDTRQVIDWTVGSNGIEDVPVTALISTPKGAPLISGIGNAVGGFRHLSLGTSPSAGTIQPSFTPSSMDFAQNSSWDVVRVGNGQASYSSDNGVTWNSFNQPSNTSLNNIAVSADGKHWVGTTSSGAIVYTSNQGNSWGNSAGVPSGVSVVSDRVNPLEFYAYNAGAGTLYRSNDGGVTFPTVTSVPQYGGAIYAGTTAEGDLWIVNWTLNHSTDKGVTFNVPSWSVGSVTGLGFGAPAPGSNNSTLFMAGQVNGVSGIYRSIDAGNSWTQINDANHQWGSISVITGDPNTFGRVYVGTSGRGIQYGDDPAACFTCQSSKKYNPEIQWHTPAPVSVGTALSSAQLNATAVFDRKVLPGTFIYTPAAGTVMSTTGTHTLGVKFEPADYYDYNSVTAEVTLTVNGGSRDTATISWPPPPAIQYGTPLSSSELDASANYPGTFTYSPALGTVLGGGTQTLNVTFTPSNSSTVAPASATTTVTVEKTAPTVTVTTASSGITVIQPLGVTVTVSGTGSTPTGSVILSSGSYSFTATLIAGTAAFTVPRGSLAAGSDTLTVTYKPDSGSTGNYSSASGTAQVTVTPLITPTVTVVPDATTHPYAENLNVAVTVAGGNSTPTGTVVLTEGSFTSSAATLSSGTATFYIQPGTLPQGAGTLTVVYTPDAASSATYTASTGTSSLNLTAPGSTNITVNINTLANRHWISPYIYGVNTLAQTDVTNLSPNFVRFGGNEATAFNWTNHHYNSAADYYYEDFTLTDGYGNPFDTVAFTQFTQNSGSHQLNTMPMVDWLPQASGWSYSVKIWGPQCSTDPYNSDAGDGYKPDCSTPVTNEPVTAAYYPLVNTPDDCPSGTTDGTTCVDRQTYAQQLAAAYGNETCNVPYSTITSCHFFDLDNEVEIWNGVHHDIHPNPPGYQELVDRFENTTSVLKSNDPNAVAFGPVTCCWYFLWAAGSPTDGRSTHGGFDYVPYWLNQVKWQDQINGARSLDVFDMHAYFGTNISTTGFTKDQLRAETGKYLRTYWDPTYYNAGYDADWITTTQPNRGVAFLVPRIKAMVNAIYPGTPLSFTEWSGTSDEWEFDTALTDADAYGSMGREGVSFSSRWGGPGATDGTSNLPHPNYQSFKLWTNYDGTRHGFGTLSVSDQSSANPDLFVSYAALNTAGNTMTIMVLNKDPNNSANVTFNLAGFNAASYTAYTVASTNPGAITSSPEQSWGATQTFAPYTITLLVVNGSQTTPPESEWNLNPDDLMVSASGTGTLHPAITSGTAPVTLTSAVFDAFEGAAACSGSVALTNSTITASQPATITVNTGSTLGFCHYTVTGTDGTTTQTQGGWIVVGQPAATFAIQSGNNQSGSAGNALSTPLTVTLTPAAGTTFTAGGASVLFTTSAGTLSNGTTTGTSVIATTNSSGVASVTLTLPSTSGTVTVTAKDQFALGGASVSFSETAN